MQAVKDCQQCGETFPRRRDLSHEQWRTQRFCSRKCLYASAKGRRMSHGYVELKLPDHPLACANGWVREHRFVVYEAGIEIPPGSHVHHKDRDKTNNALENLEVLPHSDHMKLHIAERGVVKNQYGTFTICADADERRARNTKRCVAYMRRRRAQERAAREAA